MKVLIASASVGAGHNAAARAIAAGLADAAPGVSVAMIDGMALAPRWYRAYYAGGFALAMSRFPRLYGLGYRLSDRPHKPRRGLGERLRLWQERATLRALRRRILDERPDLIVHTHFLAPPLVARLVRKGLLDARQMVVVTDVAVHRFWYSEGVERWFVPAPPSAEAFARWGIEAERVAVSGIPIHPKWDATPDRQKILHDWRLKEDRRIVLLAGGAEFTCGPVVPIAREIVASCPDACVVVLAGRNKDLLAELAVLPEAAVGRIVGVAFTDRVHELVGVSSLMVTKSGGITTSECLARGVPMVLTDPVPGQEGGNAAYFEAQGAAVVARGVEEIIAQVKRLLLDERALTRLGEQARALYRPGRQTVVSAVCEALGLPAPVE